MCSPCCHDCAVRRYYPSFSRLSSIASYGLRAMEFRTSTMAASILVRTSWSGNPSIAPAMRPFVPRDMVVDVVVVGLDRGRAIAVFCVTTTMTASSLINLFVAKAHRGSAPTRARVIAIDASAAMTCRSAPSASEGPTRIRLRNAPTEQQLKAGCIARYCNIRSPVTIEVA